MSRSWRTSPPPTIPPVETLKPRPPASRRRVPPTPHHPFLLPNSPKSPPARSRSPPRLPANPLVLSLMQRPLWPVRCPRPMSSRPNFPKRMRRFNDSKIDWRIRACGSGRRVARPRQLRQHCSNSTRHPSPGYRSRLWPGCVCSAS